MTIRREMTQPRSPAWLLQWQERLLCRRRFLLGLAATGTALLFAPGSRAVAAELTAEQRWRIIDAVQQHLFPSEPNAPGARDIRALDYLRFVVADAKLGEADRGFILQGAEWLEALCQEQHQSGFVSLGEAEREQMLRRIASSDAGENWLSTLLLYIFEALLTDPVYGGNPAGIGWQWLGHNPGLPRPTPDNRYRSG